jgi:hypothetical protein
LKHEAKLSRKWCTISHFAPVMLQSMASHLILPKMIVGIVDYSARPGRVSFVPISHTESMRSEGSTCLLWRGGWMTEVPNIWPSIEIKISKGKTSLGHSHKRLENLHWD